MALWIACKGEENEKALACTSARMGRAEKDIIDGNFHLGFVGETLNDVIY